MTRPAPARRAALAALIVATLLVAIAAPVGASTTTTTSPPWVTGVGGTLTVGIDQAPTGCNPGTVRGDNWADRLILGAVLPSSFVVNANGQSVYDSSVISQAELQSLSPETIVYTINPKAEWSDGEPVTAADFIYTWEQERGATGPLTATAATSPITPTPAEPTPSTTTVPGATAFTGPSLGYRQIQSVTSSGKGRTVTVVFATPYADWESLFNELLPAGVLEETGWDPPCTTLDPAIDLSGGPFVLSQVSKAKIVLTRNTHWWETRPDLQQIVFKVASGPAQLASWVASGKVDMALPTGFSQSYVEEVTSLATVATQSQPGDTLVELELSTTSATTASATVRTAIAHAIDRQDLLDSVVGWENSNIVPAASHLYTQGQTGYPGPKPSPLQVANQPGTTKTTTASTPTAATPFPATADPDQTAKLLEGLGYTKDLEGQWIDPTGKATTLRLAYDASDSWVSSSAPLVQDQLVAAGFTVTLVPESGAAATGEALATGAADMALLPLHADPYTSQAVAWYTTLLGSPGVGGSQDWSKLNDPVVDADLLKATEELNPKTAQPIYQEADTLLWADMVALPLFDEPTILAYSRKVAGASLGPDSSSLLSSANTLGIKVPANSPKAATKS